MIRFLQKLGKSLMLPVACLPIAAILMGIGYWIDPSGWGANNVAAAFLLKAGGAIIDNMAILFAIGVGIGMSKDGEGTAALAALISWLIIQTLLSPAAYTMFTHTEAPAAFSKLNNQFIGIVSGLTGAFCYNKFHKTQLPDALSFFSGRHCVAIVTAGATLCITMILAFLWPIVYNGLVTFGETIVSTGALGAGIYGFLNRLLVPIGLHHALNSVFWFDIAGINDLGNFWSGDGIRGVTGQYMTGFFPVMMFGLPAACLAMYHTAKTARKKIAAGLLLSAALSSFFVGITEPIEFSFMFLAPVLYAAHAVLTGLSLAVCTLLPIRVGFNFSGGFIDLMLCAKSPMAVHPLFIVIPGAVYALAYYAVFRFIITKLNLKTPGREEEDGEAADEGKTAALKGGANFTEVAQICLEGLGGRENVSSCGYCATRLRIEIKDYTFVNEKKIKSSGVSGVIRPDKTSIQIIVGPKVQFVYDELKKLID
ncbi:MAG: N-acetylglucosamine-specific PTS transporter subunit IIBC [Spirochaetaceae bacterium]|nr:N-acetylglucosamine-specific PTS transporter subunit IIBC [Spirochaetaceae bacterium]